MGAGNPGPGAGIGLPGAGPAHPGSAGGIPARRPAPPFEIYQRVHLKYTSRFRARASYPDLPDAVVEVDLPEVRSSKIINFFILNYLSPIHLYLEAESPRVRVTTIRDVTDGRFGAEFSLEALGAGNPGEPAAILSFASRETTANGRHVLLCVVEVWIEPVRGKWISGRGIPEFTMPRVPTHAVMLGGGELLLFGPRRETEGGAERFVVPRNGENGGFVWQLTREDTMDAWAGFRFDGPRPIPAPIRSICFGAQILTFSNEDSPKTRAVLYGGFADDSQAVVFLPGGARSFSFLGGGHVGGPRRFYPTMATLPSGDILVIGGRHRLMSLIPFGGVDFRSDFDDSSEHAIEIVRFRRLQRVQPPGNPQENRVLINSDIAGYPGAFVLPAAPGDARFGGALFIQERNLSYLFSYRTNGLGRNTFTPERLEFFGPVERLAASTDSSPSLRNALASVGISVPAPPIFALQHPGSRTWPWSGASVLLPLDVNRPTRAQILVVGGSAARTELGWTADSNNPSTTSAEIFDYDSDLPIARQGPWRQIQPLKFRRILCNATLLSDGTVLVTGGARQGEVATNNDPELSTELYDPTTGTWSMMEPSPTDRRAGSMALLTAAGTVITIGGLGGLFPARDNIRPQFHVDTFQPGYLFRGIPARIISFNGAPPLPGSFLNGINILELLDFEQGARIRQHELVFLSDVTDDEINEVESPDVRLALLRIGGVCFGNHMDQRLVWLTGQAELVPGNAVIPPGQARNRNDRAWRFQFRFPANPSLLPPGLYMLFVLDQRGVPSGVLFIGLDVA